MRKNTEKLAAALCAGVMILLIAAYLSFLIYAVASEGLGQLAAVVFVVIFLLILAAVILGILAALHQRLKEIDKGEADDAKIY